VRKSASIILLVVLLFNMVGYRAWFYYAEMKSDAAMEASLDRNEYNKNNLVSINIPLDNPYQLEQENFQRIHGEISFQGKTYKYVQRRVSNGNLIIQCIPDENKTVLKKARSEFGSNLNDVTGTAKNSSHPGTQKNFSGNDYTLDDYNLHIAVLNSLNISNQNNADAAGLTDAYIASPGKPPRLIA
jgi:hypothetical protein